MDFKGLRKCWHTGRHTRRYASSIVKGDLCYIGRSLTPDSIRLLRDVKNVMVG